MMVSIFVVYQEVLDGVASFEVHFNAIFPADVLVALTHSLNIGYHYVRLVVVTACVVLGITRVLVGSICCSSVLYLPCLKPMLDTCIF